METDASNWDHSVEHAEPQPLPDPQPGEAEAGQAEVMEPEPGGLPDQEVASSPVSDTPTATPTPSPTRSENPQPRSQPLPTKSYPKRTHRDPDYFRPKW